LFAFEKIMKRDGEVFGGFQDDFFGVVARVVVDDQDFPRIRDLKLAHRLERLFQLLGAVVGSDNDRKLHDNDSVNFSTSLPQSHQRQLVGLKAYVLFHSKFWTLVLIPDSRPQVIPQLLLGNRLQRARCDSCCGALRHRQVRQTPASPQLFRGGPKGVCFARFQLKPQRGPEWQSPDPFHAAFAQ